jgi:hypothetical protein
MTVNTQIVRLFIIFLIIGLIGCTPQAATLQLTEATAPLSPTNTSVLPTNTSVPPPTPTATSPLPPVCQFLEPQETSSELKPKEVVSEMVEILNTGDVATAMSYFAEDARVFVLGVPPNGYQVMFGKEEICRFLAGYADNNVEWELTDLFSVPSYGGSSVSAFSNIGLDVYRELGVISLQFIEKFWLFDGKIVEYSAYLHVDSLTQLRDVLPEIAFTKPDTSSATPGSEVTVVISNNLSTYEGSTMWQSGYIDFTIEIIDHKDEEYGCFNVHIDEGFDVFDLASALNPTGIRPAWARYRIIFDFGYWDTSTKQHHISAGGLGEMYLVCMGRRDTIIGLFGPFEVNP